MPFVKLAPRRAWTRAHRAKRRLMVRARVTGDPDVFGAWVYPIVFAVDPQAVEFGGNFGFNDGSVLSRQLKRYKVNGECKAGWRWQVNTL